MIAQVKSRWFLISLVFLIACGVSLGAWGPERQISRITGFVNPGVVTAIVLFLMSFSLDSGQLGAAFRSPAPVLWASLVNLGLVPLLAWPLMSIQLSPDLAYGLMISASVPCTMAAASVWTRQAGGNDAISLLVTVVTNGACFLLTPFWLGLATPATVHLDPGEMIVTLAVSVLVPTAAGQLVRQIPGPGHFARRFKRPISATAQMFILSIVFTAASKAGMQLGARGSQINVAGVAIVWASCVIVHIAAMVVGVAGAKAFGFRPADRLAVAFACSQKTLPIGLLIATHPSMFGNPNLLGPGRGVPFTLVPMLLYHASQLFIDTAAADWYSAKKRAEASDEGGESTASA